MRNTKRFLFAVLAVTLLFAMLMAPATASEKKIVSATAPYDTYVYDYNGNPVITPHAYLPIKVVNGNELGSVTVTATDVTPSDVDGFLNPADLEVDKNGNIYVVDTKFAVNMEQFAGGTFAENPGGSFTGRLVVLNPDYTLKMVIETFMNNGKIDGFASPEGVTIAEGKDQDGSIYVCDTENARILRFDQKGNLLVEYKKPAINIYEDDYAYNPSKVTVDGSYNMFVVARSIKEGLILLDEQGEFSGFVGAQKVTYNVVDYIWKNLLNQRAAEGMVDFVPSEYNNVKIDSSGFVYTTTSTIDAEEIAGAITSDNFDSKTSPIKRLNPTGNDVLVRRGYFSTVGDIAFDKDSAGKPETSVIEDVALGPNDRYTLLDSRLNRLFTYSSDGELIYAFSAKGYQAGNSITPVSIAYKGDELLLLDSESGSITVFGLTEYGKKIDEAYALYKTYDYTASQAKWQEVLNYNANFDIAYDGIGNALLQQGKYKEAQENFRYSNNKERFSVAWTETRAAIIEDYLLVIAAVVIVLVFAFVKLFGWIGKRNRDPKYQDKHGTFLNQFLYGFYIMVHPYDGFWDLKHEKRGNAKAGTLIAVLLIIARLISKFFTNYLFNASYGTKISIMSEVLIVMMPLLLWALANWCVTTLTDGEGKIKEIYTFTCYALLPMVLFTILNTVISHFIVLDEGMYITFFGSLSVIWSGYLLFAGNTQTHRYTAAKSVFSIFAAVLGMAIIVFLALVIFTTYQQIYTFIDSIVKEVTYRI